jgi:hypothetical protein
MTNKWFLHPGRGPYRLTLGSLTIERGHPLPADHQLSLGIAPC